MQETWKRIIYNNIPTFYEVSNTGKVRNINTNKELAIHEEMGYCHTSIKVNGVYKRCRVHRLVAQAFIPNPENKPYVNHLDGIRHNNNVENLEWCTPAENTQHAWRIGLCKSAVAKEVYQYDLKGNFIAKYESITQAATMTNSQQAKITLCCKGNRKTHNMFQWCYSDNTDCISVLERPKTISKKVRQYKDGELIATFDSFREAARAVNGTSSAISRVCSGLNKTHKGYNWKVVDDIVQY